MPVNLKTLQRLDELLERVPAKGDYRFESAVAKRDMDFEEYTRFALETLEGRLYDLAPHQKLIIKTLLRVMSGEIKRLIINIPPGYAKTAIAVWSFISYIYSKNASAKVLHISYSNELVKDNSVKVRDIISSLDYRHLYPHVEFKLDTSAKGLWATSKGGYFRASASGASITGFRAGYITDKEEFTGCMVIDDPVKPDDAFSYAKMDAVNRRWESTFRSRLACDDVPVIVIMQRIADDDFTAHLLNNSGEQWHHLVLPAYIDRENFVYDQGGIYIDHDLPNGSLWDVKATDEEAKMLMNNIQYSQDPTPPKGDVVEREWFEFYSVGVGEMMFKRFVIYCDTASKIKKYNDYSVFGLFGVGLDNRGYMLKMWRGKVKVPNLQAQLEHFYDDALKLTGEGRIKVYIEDKDSGVGLIQSLQDETRIPVYPIQRKEGKYARLLRATVKIKERRFVLPKNDEYSGMIINEFIRFKADDSHAHDDMVDVCVDFINNELPTQSAKFASSAKIVL